MVPKFRSSRSLVLCAFACVHLSACGTSSAPGGSANAVAATTTPTITSSAPAPSPVPSTASTSALSYDTSVGSGVDANGYANLPLRSGAHRYYVNSASGSDGNGCSGAQQPTTPFKTIAAAVACVQGGNGDQVLVAEGTTYSEALPLLDHAGGYDPTYPTVVESYDPSDPTNESKLGRAANGRRPVVNTGANNQQITCCAHLPFTPANYIAIRGFDFNPGNVPDMNMAFAGSDGTSNNYILIENNLFEYTQLIFDGAEPTEAAHLIARKNAFYGEWSANAHQQGIYVGSAISFTAEDNVFWHTGWKVGASRDDTTANGGPTIFRHSIYAQTNTSALVRRNIFIDPSATGCSCRGDVTELENVFIDNPISIIAGQYATSYESGRDSGVNIDVERNAVLGDADINSTAPRGEAIMTSNGKPGSMIRNNLIVRSRNPNGMNVYAFYLYSDANLPSYATFDSNLVYQFSTPTYTVGYGIYPAQDFPTYTNNKWDAPASGGNINSAGLTFPNPYTEAQLWVALGCADKATCVNQMIATPEANWAVKARALLWQGYAMP